MYKSFFKLSCKPFDLIPNPEFMFLSRTHKKAITYLDYGIRERAGFILLTGEVGSGKTTIIREMINQHMSQVVLAKVFNTSVNSDQLLSMINDDFGLPVGGKDKIELLRDLNHFLVEQYAQGNQPLLIIDEAQNLPVETLEQVRMLSNLETADSKLLQIILVGQPELRALLAKPELRQLRQRISIQCFLQPLNRQEVEEYILHRLEVAGNRDALHFSTRSLDLIYLYCGGIPRLVNIVCDFLLLAAFVERTREVDEEMIRDIIGDADLGGYCLTDEARPAAAYAEGSAASGGRGAVPWSDRRFEDLFGCLLQRMDASQEELLAKVAAPLKELNGRLEQLQAALAGQIRTTGAALSELREEIKQLPQGPAAPLPTPADGKGSKATLMQRIFG